MCLFILLSHVGELYVLCSLINGINYNLIRKSRNSYCQMCHRKINRNEKKQIKLPWQERIGDKKKVADFKHLFIYYKRDMTHKSVQKLTISDNST